MFLRQAARVPEESFWIYSTSEKDQLVHPRRFNGGAVHLPTIASSFGQ
jgi:hypothetical protein